MTKLRKPLDPALFQELETETDRGAALVGASIVDYTLGRVLLCKMRPLSNTDAVKVFESRGPLSGFASRTELCFAMSLFGPQTRRELNCIRDIRNEFAHSPAAGLTFDASNIKKFAQNLRLIDEGGYPIYPGMRVRKPTTLRERFNHTICLMASQLEWLTVGLEPTVLRK